MVDGEIAYRYKYRTNNLGFVSEYDYQREKDLDLVIVGDSVSEGQEVGPWLDVFQKELQVRYGKTSQNMAVAGNGFIEFERATTFAKNSLKARKAMLIFIGDDMHRSGDTMVANEECSTYKSLVNADAIDCFAGLATWHNYDANISDSRLVQFALSRQSLGLLPVLRSPVKKFAIGMSRLVCKTGLRINFDERLSRRFNQECIAQDADDALIARETNSIVENYSIAIPAYTISALEKILRRYGPENVLLVGIQSGGYAQGAGRGYALKDMNFQAELARLLGGQFKEPIQYADLSEVCGMPRELWAPRLSPGPRKGYGHPTAEGYRALQACFMSNERVLEFAKQ